MIEDLKQYWDKEITPLLDNLAKGDDLKALLKSHEEAERVRFSMSKLPGIDVKDWIDVYSLKSSLYRIGSELRKGVVPNTIQLVTLQECLDSPFYYTYVFKNPDHIESRRYGKLAEKLEVVIDLACKLDKK